MCHQFLKHFDEIRRRRESEIMDEAASRTLREIGESPVRVLEFTSRIEHAGRNWFCSGRPPMFLVDPIPKGRLVLLVANKKVTIEDL